MKQQKDELENLLDGKFLTASKFSMEIEKIVLACKGELNYMEAVICYCCLLYTSPSPRDS